MAGAHVFVSYSHRDDDHRDRVESHLSALRRQGLIEVWTDHRIVPGEELDAVIRSKLQQAEIVLLIVTTDFIRSEYCWSVEMAASMRRHEAGSVAVVPVIAEPCDWSETPFGKLKAVPKDGVPVTRFRNRADAYQQVAFAIRQRLQVRAMQSNRPPTLERVLQRLSPGSADRQEIQKASGPQPRLTLKEWEIALATLYPTQVAESPMYELTLQLVADATGIAEAMRKRDYTEAGPRFAGVLTTLCLMTSKVRESENRYRDLTPTEYLEEVVWQKYPGLCPVCAENRCLCPALNVDRLTYDERQSRRQANEDKFNQARARLDLRPSYVDGWVELFDGLYGNIHSGRSSASKTFHFLEEVGEVEIEMKRADQAHAEADATLRAAGNATNDWAGELADVFSWMATIFLHVRGYVLQAQGFTNAFGPAPIRSPATIMMPSMEGIMRTVYFKTGEMTCPRCGMNPCVEAHRRR